eukprot:3584066-Prymnesium_polylepis.4
MPQRRQRRESRGSGEHFLLHAVASWPRVVQPARYYSRQPPSGRRQAGRLRTAGRVARATAT